MVSIGTSSPVRAAGGRVDPRRPAPIRPGPPPPSQKGPDVTALSRCAALALAVLLLAGCGALPGPSDEGSARERAAAIVDQVRSAVEEAKERARERTGDVERGASAGEPSIRTSTADFD